MKKLFVVGSAIAMLVVVVVAVARVVAILGAPTEPERRDQRIAAVRAAEPTSLLITYAEE